MLILSTRHVSLKEGPPILYGKNPTDLPNYEIGSYETGSETIVGCYTGPQGGLSTVKRTEKHLSVLDADIDFIDTPQEEQGKNCHFNFVNIFCNCVLRLKLGSRIILVHEQNDRYAKTFLMCLLYQRFCPFVYYR